MKGGVFASIDVGTTKVCTVVGEVFPDQPLRILGVGIAAANGLSRGMVENLRDASESVRTSVEQAERSSGTRILSAHVGVAGPHISCQNNRGIVAIPDRERPISPDDVARVLDGARIVSIPTNREIIHVEPRYFIVDGQDHVSDPVGMYGQRLDVETHIISGLSTVLQNETKCVESAGVQVESYVLNPLASAEVVLTDTEREMGCVVCDIGGGTTDLAIYIEGNVWHTMVLSVGGNHITSDIAHGLRLPADLAEKIKIDHGSARPKDVDASEYFSVKPFGEEKPVQVSKSDLAMIIQARVEETFNLVLQEIKRSGYDGLLPAGIVLTGGTALLPGIRLVASEVLNLSARVAEPTDLRGLVDTIRGPQFATSVGLLKWAARETLAAARTPTRGRKGRKTLDDNISRMSDWFKRLLP